MRRCECGKIIYLGAEAAMKEAAKQKSRLPMWAYECHTADNGTFHLTTRGGSSKYKVTPNGEVRDRPHHETNKE